MIIATSSISDAALFTALTFQTQINWPSSWNVPSEDFNRFSNASGGTNCLHPPHIEKALGACSDSNSPRPGDLLEDRGSSRSTRIRRSFGPRLHHYPLRRGPQTRG